MTDLPSAPAIGSRWVRPDFDPSKGPYNDYGVLGVTNTAHLSDKHPPQVIYIGSNGHLWSTPLSEWPGNLVLSAKQPANATEESLRDITVNIMKEARQASKKYPEWPTDPLHAVSILGEEYGELVKAVLQLSHEPHKTSLDEVHNEAVQTGAMVLRFIASLKAYQFARSAMHKQTLQ